jgi:IS605 OrfB family transposase
MRLVEKHIIKDGHRNFDELDKVCFLSKNLYNKANYLIRQQFIHSGKWIRYHQLQKTLQSGNDGDYTALPRKVSQQVLMLLDKNWKSFFKAIKVWKSDKSKFTGKPKLPRYKHKTKGRNLVIYTIQAISKKKQKNGIISLSGTHIQIQTKQTHTQQVRVIPGNRQYVIEIIYNKKEVELKHLDKTKIAGIDLGLNNLATVTSNQNIRPLLINGRPLKSMNQYYNKKKALYQSFVAGKSSNRIRKLTNKRNRKVDNYLHHASRYIVGHLINYGIGTVVIGQNKQWKTEINIGCRNNQNFVSIPHLKLFQMIQYKCQLVGIDIITTEESYTSKCSFIDFEPIQKHETYSGKRKYRGLFVSGNGTKINADCNGSGNIIRKEFPNAFADGIEGVVVHPIRITPYKLSA